MRCQPITVSGLIMMELGCQSVQSIRGEPPMGCSIWYPCRQGYCPQWLMLFQVRL